MALYVWYETSYCAVVAELSVHGICSKGWKCESNGEHGVRASSRASLRSQAPCKSSLEANKGVGELLNNDKLENKPREESLQY